MNEPFDPLRAVAVFRHEAMATHFEIVVAGHPAEYARQASAAAFRTLDRLEAELSRFVENSDVSRANRLAAGESLAIGADAFECLLIAADASLAVGQAFDPAYASVPVPGRNPEAPRFTLDPENHVLTSEAARLHLDLGAVGKGYALDRLADVLAEWEVRTACLNSGGSTVLALDPPPGAAGWPVGVGEGDAARTLSLARAALSGSGTAVKGAHLIDPRTGRPATRAGRAWALAPSAALADALSTAFFVLEDDAIARFCAEHPQIGAATSAGERLRTYGTLSAN